MVYHYTLSENFLKIGKCMRYKAETEMDLLNFLREIFPDSSKNTLRQWIRDGRIYVDGKVALEVPLLLLPGQTVTFKPRMRYLEGGIRILYEDKDILAIEKPSGILSVATHFEKKDTAYAILRRYFHPRRLHVVHRLDQDTSGVMLFALSEKGKTGLKNLFASHDLLRQYIALVEGHLEPSKGTWRSHLVEDKNYKVHIARGPRQGELAITHYVVEKASDAYSRLRLTLETGRKNQIRVHCQAAGHSIAGDDKYGAESDPIHRLALHAARLEFVHPITGKKMIFFSPVPEAFERIVK
jgi:tRNA pseudouridine32 synthase/23S rRNA pseudouridine746 synthase/23S rRNA pseudouridine1911/1915/1917 synthase